MKIVLVGGAGAPNYGDELIVKGWMDFFSKYLPEANLVFYENIAKKAKQLHGEKENVVFKDDLVNVAKSYTKASFWEQVIRGYLFIDNGGIEKYEEFDLQPLFEADILHLHGGGYLNNYDPEKGFYIGFLASLKEKFDKKIVATGIGFGPAPEPNNNQLGMLNSIFKQFDFFELRDVDNFRWLKSRFSDGHFLNGLDDCYLYSASEIVEYDGSRKRLYLSFLAYNFDKISDDYWQKLSVFANQFDDVLFFESYPWQDKEVFEKVRAKLPKVKKLTVQDSLFKKIKVGKKDYAICSRFHVHFVLSRAGVNGVYSRDSKYYNVKHQSIVDRGSSMKYTDFSTVDFVESDLKSQIEVNEMLYYQQKVSMCQDIYLSS